MPKSKGRRYLVVAGTSTRKSTDRDSDDFETWLDFRAGDKVDADDMPSHTPIYQWVKSGHWVEEGK